MQKIMFVLDLHRDVSELAGEGQIFVRLGELSRHHAIEKQHTGLSRFQGLIHRREEDELPGYSDKKSKNK
jgi:hypothetical protein